MCFLCWSGGWNLQSYHSMSLGSTPVQPIRCCLAKGSRLWVGYWNKVHVVDVDSRKIEVKKKTLQKHDTCPCLAASCHYHLFTLTANFPSVGAQREAGSFPVRWGKWRLGGVPTRPDPQAVRLVHREAVTGSGFQCFGHQNFRYDKSSSFLSCVSANSLFCSLVESQSLGDA